MKKISLTKSELEIIRASLVMCNGTIDKPFFKGQAIQKMSESKIYQTYQHLLEKIENLLP